MGCERCQGLLLREAVGRRARWWLKCVNCGNRIDQAILQHRVEDARDQAWRREAEQHHMAEWAAWLQRGLVVTERCVSSPSAPDRPASPTALAR